jgi:hypothetical protein
MMDWMESLQSLPMVNADITPILLPRNITLESSPTHSATAKKAALNSYGLSIIEDDTDNLWSWLSNKDDEYVVYSHSISSEFFALAWQLEVQIVL